MGQYVPEEEVEPSFDLAQLRERASYVTGAIRRHPLLLIGVGALTLLGAALVARLLPDRYQVETRVIAQQDDWIARLSNPGRPEFDDANLITRTVSDLVLRRDNLLGIIRANDLLRRWRATRPPLFRLKDWVVFHHPLSDEELTDVLVGTLEKRITVTAHPGAVITFAVVWDDPASAQKIAEMVLSDFIENRTVNEMAILGETIRLLEERLREADKAMDETLSSARSFQRPSRPVPSRVARPAPTPAPIVETVELARLHGDIIQKRRALDDLITLKERAVADLQAQLVRQRAVYSDTHPVVANLRSSLETMSADSPQIIQARKELAELEGRYLARGGLAETLEGVTETRPSSPTGEDTNAATSSLLAALDAVSRDPGEEYARGRLASAITRYYVIADRLQSARIERDAARANLKFRYTVIKPPLPPRESTTGIYRTALFVVGVLAAPLFGIAAALALELRRGRVSHKWQLERLLGLPVVAALTIDRQR